MNDEVEDYATRDGGVDVAGNARDVISDPQAPVNTGPGTQVNVAIERAIIRAWESTEGYRPRPRQAVAEDEIEWLARRFVEPGNFSQAGVLLRDRRTVLLGGPPGSGRRSAALMLLARLPGHATVRCLPPDADENVLLDPDEIEQGERLLLDLTNGDDDALELLHGQLGGFRATLLQKEAHLAVVLPGPHDGIVTAEFRPLATDISRPPAVEVLRRHLQEERVPFALQDLNDEMLRPQLSTGSMGQLAHLARLMRRAREDNGRKPFRAWLRTALAGLTDRGAEVAARVRGKSGQDRALMFVTAFLHGGPVDVVPDAENRLLRALDFPDDETHVLDRPDLVERLSGIGAQVDPGRRVRFPGFAWDSAVRSHFWLVYSTMRPQFLTWAADLVETANLDEEDTDRIAHRLVEQCLRWRQPNDVVPVAKRWAEKGVPRLASAATVLLVQGLSHEAFGGTFRRHLYYWSREASLNPNLARIVIALCRDVLAPSLPDRALVRLHHLTRHRDREVSAEAVDALTSLAENRRFFRRLVDRLARWVATGDKFLSSVDVMLLTRVARAERLLDDSPRARRLIDDRDVRAQLELLWNAMLRSPEQKAWSPLLDDWLRTTLDEATGVPLDVLFNAAGRDTRLLGVLFQATSRWASATDDPGDQARRDRLRQQVLDKINDVMGLRVDVVDPSEKESAR
ncbi:hypothetical protein LX15_004689 [Streptoalloteichus tenebrarius]|uniref:Uncharacterized protein n=1 Tax=Streptoalloteichus tenebrarius (strain ATCC 17920 / DSM 40477 / JCM 4838 / CBS 697.72 / NBRC 16177 / NCIMB 11028 / NRRL B-12390 / A12253. 1 / ISP 5477) TaxID=1933 RepID=A0ABT1HZK9_STRSD|nr:hypothetical protein [Streptoalloteichus tenebrarius]MCP2260969.1 hypothetical protein [Streptoalloteichus tenebrarius]BFE98907.1 hypothetical protein GCM10020241_05830 [Streptoalloteichus tenebrarius]